MAVRQSRQWVRSLVIGLAAAAVLTGCARLSDNHGYVPEPSALEEIAVGRDTKETVALIAGRPGTEGIVDDGGWYYVASSYERFLWRAPVETDRQVVAISFDDRDVVTNIERFGLEDGRVIVLSRRVTTSNTQGVGFLRQLFGNFGRIDPGQFLGEN